MMYGKTIQGPAFEEDFERARMRVKVRHDHSNFTKMMAGGAGGVLTLFVWKHLKYNIGR